MSLVKHIRVSKNWTCNIRDKKVSCHSLKVVVPSNGAFPEEEAFTVQYMSANWSEYSRSPVVDIELRNITVDISLDELVRLKSPETNWHKLSRSGFPPRFPSSRSHTRPGQLPEVPKPGPKLRAIECQGFCVLRVSATILGRQVSMDPEIRVPGEVLTALWDKARFEQGSEALGIEEASRSLVKVVIDILLSELSAASKGEEGPLLSALIQGLQRVQQNIERSVLTQASNFLESAIYPFLDEHFSDFESPGSDDWST